MLSTCFADVGFNIGLLCDQRRMLDVIAIISRGVQRNSPLCDPIIITCFVGVSDAAAGIQQLLQPRHAALSCSFLYIQRPGLCSQTGPASALHRVWSCMSAQQGPSACLNC